MVKPVSGDALALRIGALALRLGKRRALGFEDIELPVHFEESRPVSPLPILPMWQQEQRIIEDAIRSFAGNITLAAAALELSPSTIYRKRQSWAEVDGKQGAA
jgi:transcriptional regulator of acetoin/glycerol metabolism